MEMVQDKNGREFQALRPGNSQFIVANTSSANRSAVIANADIIRITADSGTWFRVGNNTVSASAGDHYLPPNTPFILTMGVGASRQNAISFLGFTANSNVFITELS
jgi:hypothetical protein